MELPEYVVRPMSNRDFEQVLRIYAKTGMALSDTTLNTWIKIDPDGMFVASTSEGDILGSCCTVFFKGDMAFLGLYAVLEPYRGKGVGGKILKAALDHLEGRNCALNTAEDHLITYRDRAGFHLQSQIISLECSSNNPSRILEGCETLLKISEGVTIVPVTSDIVREVVKYDHAVHGHDRELIVTLSLQEANCLALAAFDQAGNIKGYGIMTKDIRGYAILQPLYADDQGTAEALAYKMIKSYKNAHDFGLVFMALKSNPGSVTLLEKLNLNVDEVYERLFTNKIVTIPHTDKVFSQHSLDFCNF